MRCVAEPQQRKGASYKERDGKACCAFKDTEEGKHLACLRNQSTTVARVQGERKGTQPSEGGGTAVARA